MVVSLIVAHGSQRARLVDTQRSVRLPSYAVLDERTQPVITASGKTGFVASVTAGTVMAFSMSSGKIFSSISVGESVGPISLIEFAGRRLIAAPAMNDPRQGHPSTITIVDATIPKSLATQTLLMLPLDAMITTSTRALLSSDGRFCFIASSFDEPALLAFNVEDGSLVSRVPLAGRPSEIVMHDFNGIRMIAVSSSVSNSLSLLAVRPDGSLTEPTVFTPKDARFEEANNPAFSSDGRSVFIAATTGDRLFQIDSHSGLEIASIAVRSPWRVTTARKATSDYIAITRNQNQSTDKRGGVSVLTSDGHRLQKVSEFDPPDGVQFSSTNNAVLTSDANTVFVGSTTGILFAFDSASGDRDSYNVVGSELRRIALTEKGQSLAAIRSGAQGDQVVIVKFDVEGDEAPDPNTPIIDSLNPGIVEQGRLKNLKLTVAGRNFTQGASLVVNGGQVAAELGSDGRTLSARLPKALFDQVGLIGVSVRGTNGSTSEPKPISVIRPNTPVLEQIEPAEVPGPAQSFSILVKGTNFRNSSTIVVGDQPLNTEHISDKKLRAQVPAEIANIVGTVKVTVKDLALQDLAAANNKDLSIFGPRISSLKTSVDDVVAGDKRFTLRIEGSNFRAGAQVQMLLNGKGLNSGGVQVIGSKLIKVSVGQKAFQDAGTMSVVVRNQQGGESDPATLTIHAPQIDSFVPMQLLAGSTDARVDIRGANFRKGARVYVGNETNATRVDRQLVTF